MFFACWRIAMKKRFALLSAVAICASVSVPALADPVSDIHLEPGAGGRCNSLQANVNAHNTNASRPIMATICYHNAGVEASVPNVFLAPGQIRRVLSCDFGDAWVCKASYYTGHPGRKRHHM
jgi:hypothetical protein